MTTKPKAKKFRIKRSAGTTPSAAPKPSEPTQTAAAPAPGDDFGAGSPLGRIKPTQRPATPEEIAAGAGQSAAQAGAPKAMAGEVSSAAQVQGETEIDAIRQEGLTGRQLRLARRVAQKHKIAATSDFDAVRQLRLRGIDPFQRVNMLELVVPGEKQDAETQAKLPQTVPAGGQNVPAKAMDSPMQQRVREVAEIQKDIAKRRRKQSIMLGARLAFFVLLPALICGFYFYAVATPMYATKSAFIILKADGGGAVPQSLLGSSPLRRLKTRLPCRIICNPKMP